MSSYVVDREPGKYGARQADFLNESRRIVEETATCFHKSATGDLIALFHTTLSQLANERSCIAKAHGSEEAELFGVRRDQEQFSGYPLVTSMQGVYAQYGQKVLRCIQRHLSQNSYSEAEGFTPKEKVIEGQKCLERASKLHLTMFSQAEYKGWQLPLSQEEVQECCRECGIQFQRLGDRSWFIRHKQLMSTYKQKYPNSYGKFPLMASLGEATIFSEYSIDWIHVKMRLEVEAKKCFAISQYIMPVVRHPSGISCLLEYSKVQITHLDVFLIPKVLEAIAKVFKEAIECQSKDLAKLKEKVAYFSYLFAHATPFKRGSAAISEWFERAIYCFHGYELSYQSDKMANLEALTQLLPDFMAKYDEMVKIKPLQVPVRA